MSLEVYRSRIREFWWVLLKLSSLLFPLVTVIACLCFFIGPSRRSRIRTS